MTGGGGCPFLVLARYHPVVHSTRLSFLSRAPVGRARNMNVLPVGLNPSDDPEAERTPEFLFFLFLFHFDLFGTHLIRVPCSSSICAHLERVPFSFYSFFFSRLAIHSLDAARSPGCAGNGPGRVPSPHRHEGDHGRSAALEPPAAHVLLSAAVCSPPKGACVRVCVCVCACACVYRFRSASPSGHIFKSH